MDLFVRKLKNIQNLCNKVDKLYVRVKKVAKIPLLEVI